MSDRFDEVKSLLRQKDYLTVVRQQGDGCIVTYPHPKLLHDSKKIPRLIQCISIQRGNEPGFWVNTTMETNSKERFIPLPEYAMRLYIAFEIAACNSQIPINAALVSFEDGEGREYDDIEDIIPSPSSEDEKKKEGILYGLIVEAKNDGFPPEFEKVAETHGVAEGYRIIRKFYEV
jgi:hypothetical protein